jgi:hypothetical protein
VPVGEAFSPSQRDEIARAIRIAEQLSGFHFSVFVGASESESRVFAERLHAHLDDPAHSVLVMVDPAARRLEIVTGLAALTMQTAFTAGDLVAGIVSGVQQLGERARQPRTLHTDTS